jgi:hypothetical protein
MAILTAAVLLLSAQTGPEVLERSCVKCHNAKTRKGGLDLTTRKTLLEGGESGPGVGKRLLELVRHESDPKMPSKGPKLPEREIAALAAWIDRGMPYDRPLVDRSPREVHWAFRPLSPGSLASLDRGTEVDRRTLLRRATFDLTGLPPTPEEMEAFLRDGDYEREIDRLLASPRYGERWGRHWLDVARYADSAGYESDQDRKTIYPFRDAVIRAFNEDLPFDQFVRWQLAGDRLKPDDPLALALTGFLTCGPEATTTPTDSRRNKEKYRADEIDDLVTTTAQAFLGLTLGCARCHDHKFDPISSREYYQLAACFVSTRREETPLSGAHRRLKEWLDPRRAAVREANLQALPIPESEKDILRQPVHANNALSAGLHKKYAAAVTVSDETLRGRLSEEERSTWDDLARSATGTAPSVHAIAEGEPRKAYLLGRGDVDEKVDEVHPAPLQALGGPWEGEPRVALGRWLTEVEKGAGRLLARVIANRLVLHHLGEGLVATPNDFGMQGDRPTDPALLDGLASDLVAHGWSLKALHRRILLSRAYRSERRPVRLEAEALRDAMLAVSGRLDESLYGPAVRVRIPAEAMVTRTKDEYPKNAPDSLRRSIYLFVKRSVPTPFLEVFDGPSPSASCGRRSHSTVATQAVTLLNDPFVRECARAFAARARTPERAFLLALGRPARPLELEAARGMSLEDLCHVLFLTNEFAYVD